MRIAIGLIWILALVCFYIGCSTDSPVVGNPAQPPDSFDSLPALPAGNHDVRRTSIVDSDTQPGNAAIEFANATPFAGQLLMTAGEATVGDLAYGMYQFVPRVDPPVMFTIESTYYDADPLQADPGEAFWFGYGDYDRGSWVFSGPHLPSQTRVPIPEGANLQSGGGFVYCVIISIDSTILTLHSVSLSYDAGPGYEETWLAPPAGDAVADFVDLKLDTDGNPQIAYLVGDQLYDSEGRKARIATLVDDEWSIENIPSIYDVLHVRLALGDDGRRALLLQDTDSYSLWLLYDNGGGSFAESEKLTIDVDHDCWPGLTFINGNDDPANKLDTALVAWPETISFPDHAILYYRYDGVNPVLAGDVVGTPVTRVGALNFIPRADKSGVLALPLATDPGVDEVQFWAYSASTDAWAASDVPSWQNLDIENDFIYNPALSCCELASGEPPVYETAGLFRSEDDEHVVLGRTDDGSWVSTPDDVIACQFNEVFSLDRYNDNSVGFLATYDDFYLALYQKQLGAGAPEIITLDTKAQTGRHGSLAIDATDVTHVASWGWGGEGLMYYQVGSEGAVERTIVDNGGLATSMTFGYAPLAYANNELYVFYTDSAHGQLLYATNENGIWTREGEAIPGTSLCYNAAYAGYLATDDLLYATYFEFPGFEMQVVTFAPGSSTYEVNDIAGSGEGMPSVADDGHNLGSIWPQDNEGNYELMCVIGPPGTPLDTPEIVTADDLLLDAPNILAYNSVTGTWAALTHHGIDERCYLFYRAGADTWEGPYTVAEQAGIDADVFGRGLDFDRTTGDALVTVGEQADGSDILDINVYRGDASTGVFDAPITVVSYDTTLVEVDGFATTPSTSGEPIIAIQVKPLAADTWDIEVYGPDGLGGFVYMFTWNSPVLDPAGGKSALRLATMPDDLPAIATIEQDETAEQYGQVATYYPW